MDDGIDIVVTSRDLGRPELVVEVKLQGKLDEAIAQVRRYMARAGVPLGLVVVASRLCLLRETYAIDATDSIRLLADVSTSDVAALVPPTGTGQIAGFEFETRVQAWLESLVDPEVVAALPDGLRAVARDHLVPAIENSIVGAAGPRSRPRVSRSA